ncbi:hypothetical protein GQ457_17G008390 [Hibiscus cannabinus]
MTFSSDVEMSSSKGLHHAMSRLRDGFFWTVGIDSQVCLFRDRWGVFSPVTLVGGSADREEIPLRCREFMLPGQASWDHSKLSARLSPVDMDSILEVPISPDRADTHVWGDHDSGLYTVRSGYLFLRRPPSPLRSTSAFMEDSGKTPYDSEGALLWLALWTGSSSRGIPAPGCRTLFMSSVTVQIPQRPFNKLASLTPSFLRTGQRRQTGLALRHLLSLRTRWLCSSPFSGASGDVRIPGCMSALSILCISPSRMLSRSAMILPQRLLPPRPPLRRRCSPRWRPPPAGSVKINVDGAFLPSACLGAIGVLARDSSGAVLGGFARPVPVRGPASAVEASALLAGLEFAITSGWASALVESDAAVLINKLHRPTMDLSLLGDLLAPSRTLLAASNGCLHVGFAPRSANSAAHALASWACHHNNVISFSSVCPELISHIVLDDLSSSF